VGRGLQSEDAVSENALFAVWSRGEDKYIEDKYIEDKYVEDKHKHACVHIPYMRVGLLVMAGRKACMFITI